MICLITGGHEPQQSGQNRPGDARGKASQLSVSERASQRRGYSGRLMQSDRADNFARGSGFVHDDPPCHPPKNHAWFQELLKTPCRFSRQEERDQTGQSLGRYY